MYLGLVPAVRGADVVATSGWDLPVNHTTNNQLFATVLRSWEERFGALVVGLRADLLTLAVRRPPTSARQCRALTAEHMAFCPDRVDSGRDAFESYARELAGNTVWSFGWD